MPPGLAGLAEPMAAAIAELVRLSRPYIDQFYIYNTFSKTQNIERYITTFIIKYKAPYKLTLSYIYKGFNNIELKEVVYYYKINSLQDYFRCLVTAIITQTFSYIV